MGKFLLMVFVAFCYSITAPAQKNDAAPAKEKTFNDFFKGKVPLDNKRYVTELILTHCKYCDEGKFILKETKMESLAGDKAIEIKGDWTVLKGDADYRYATVVEIDAKTDTLYFLRLNSGNLQMLDAKLREIEPAKNYLLRKQ